MPADAPLAADTLSTVALRVTLQAVASDSQLGRFSLQANQVSPSTVFLSLSQLGRKIEQPGYANTILISAQPEGNPSIDAVNEALEKVWELEDAGLKIRVVDERGTAELRSRRIFIEPAVEEAAFGSSLAARGVLTYFVNGIHKGERTTPYSFVSAPGPPLVPVTMDSDEIIITRWLADDLGAVQGDILTLTYYVMAQGSRLEENQTSFTVREVIPTPVGSAYRELMPPFPGLAEVDNCRDWDPGIPLNLNAIRSKDQDYWDRYRGTPKAFITLDAARTLWENRFGGLTAVRFPGIGPDSEELGQSIMDLLRPSSLDLSFEPVLQQGLRAGRGAVDFGQLFLGLSMFILTGALLLTGLLYALSLQGRSEQTGILLSLGYTPSRVRLLLTVEGLILALLGCSTGTLLGVFYNRAVLHGLNTFWRDAAGTTSIQLHITAQSLIHGFLSSFLLVLLVLLTATYRQSTRPLSDLRDVSVSRTTRQRRRFPAGSLVLSVICLCSTGVLLVMSSGDAPGQMHTFVAGFLMLLGTVLLLHYLMGRSKQALRTPTGLPRMALRNFLENRGQNLTACGMLACGIFVVIAVGSNRPVPLRTAQGRTSGTGGFILFGETTLPILHDLNTEGGRNQYGLELENFHTLRFVQLRVYEGEDASCLNLNRTENPRILGITPDTFAELGAFSFAKRLDELSGESPWLLLYDRQVDGTIPAIADQTVITWGLKKTLGDVLEYKGETGETVKLKLVAGLDNSVFQGSVLVNEQALLEHFPSVSGSRMFLVDGSPEQAAETAEKLKNSFRNHGILITTPAARLNEFNRVTNTYLSIFLFLGGLGIVLGSFGLGIMVYRNIMERRSELSILRAVGFPRGLLYGSLFVEHAFVLAAGVAAGTASALVAVLPSLFAPDSGVPFVLIFLILGALVLNGSFWIYLSAILATRGNLIPALRDE
jgi:ABC-type lipoprotein release transport system permease subunit